MSDDKYQTMRRGLVCRIKRNGKFLTWYNFLKLLNNSDFSLYFSRALLELGQDEPFFLECEPVSYQTMKTKIFRFAVLPAPQLIGKKADPKPFREHFAGIQQNRYTALAFPNLSGDCYLVTPYCAGEATCQPDIFTHLGKFLAESYDMTGLVTMLWSKLAETMLTVLKDNQDDRIWLSTHGLGVHWVHFRVSLVPKYYQYTEFKH